MKFGIIPAAWCAVALAASRPAPTLSGNLPAQQINRIVAAGDLIVRGRKTNVIRYVVPIDAARIEISSGTLVFPEATIVQVEVPRTSLLLYLSSASASVDAADLDGSVFVTAPAGRVMLDRIAGDVEVHSGGGATSLGTIGGSARCYSRAGNIRAVRVRGQSILETGGGDIQVGDVLGPLRAVTGAGGIHIDQAGSQVFAQTLGGPIAILRASAPVVAKSGGGPIEIGAAPGVRCQSASGTIRLNGVSGTLQASTESGSIVAEILHDRPLSDSLLSTGAGDITVFIPSHTGVSIEAEATGTRDVRSILTDFKSLQIARRRTSVLATGSINGGGPLLRIVGFGGRIEIRKK